MEFYSKPVATGKPADAYCAECGSSMTRDEAALNYKLVGKKTEHLLCPVCLGKKMELSPETLRNMIDLFRRQGCTLFTPWVEN